jgi:hypothetical protein
MAAHLPRQAQVRPQAREGNHALLDRIARGKETSRGWVAEVEAVAVVAPQGQQGADQVQGIIFRAGAPGDGRPAGVNPNEHDVQITNGKSQIVKRKSQMAVMA